MSKPTSGRHFGGRAAHGRGRHRRRRNGSCPSIKVCETMVSHRKSSDRPDPRGALDPDNRVHRARRQALHSSGGARSFVTAGLTLVGASALIGSFVAPTPSNFDATRVQLASTQHDVPAPAQPLNSLTAGGG